ATFVQESMDRLFIDRVGASVLYFIFCQKCVEAQCTFKLFFVLDVRMCRLASVAAMIPITRFRPSSVTSSVHLSPCIRQRDVLLYLYEEIFRLSHARLCWRKKTNGRCRPFVFLCCC